MIQLGHIREIVRYPVKSMAGIRAESVYLGWHGIGGDRRFAFRRLGDGGGFPWLSASRVPELLLYHPVGLDGQADEPLPAHIRTPAGAELELESGELQSEIAGRFGGSVEMIKLKHGIFDEAALSIITLATIAGIGRKAGMDLDRRRFRANIVVQTHKPEPFQEDGWVGGRLVFGDDESGPIVSVTMRDVRCSMVNLDPDTAGKNERVMKTVVELNRNNAGVYATVVQTGRIRVGQAVSLLKC